MFTAILWDYDGTLANTPVKNIAVTRAVLGRLDPALLDPLPEALSSLAAYQAANYRWKGRLKSIFSRKACGRRTWEFCGRSEAVSYSSEQPLKQIALEINNLV